MTTVSRLGAALLGVTLFLSPALAQDDADRTLRRSDDGATTTLTARPDGDTWRVELTRERSTDPGTTSRERMQLTFPRTDAVDREVDELFQNPPDDPDEWARRIKDLAKVDVDGDADGLPDAQRLRELSERMRDEVRQGFEQARDQLRELMDRVGRDEGQQGAETDEAGTDRVWLTSGGQVSGDLLSVDETTVRLRTPGGEVELSRDQVRRIELASDAPAAKAQASLGVAITDEAEGGVRVEAVRPGTAAATADLRERDVITSFDGQPVRDSAHLREVVAAHQPGDAVTLGVRRGDDELEVQVKLGAPVPLAPIPDPGMGPF